MENQVIICSCLSIEHQVIFTSISNEPEVYMNIHLVKHSFWKRVKYGIKYIFGYKSIYGQWDEIILDSSHIKSLQEVINHLEKV